MGRDLGVLLDLVDLAPRPARVPCRRLAEQP